MTAYLEQYWKLEGEAMCNFVVQGFHIIQDFLYDFPVGRGYDGKGGGKG